MEGKKWFLYIFKSQPNLEPYEAKQKLPLQDTSRNLVTRHHLVSRGQKKQQQELPQDKPQTVATQADTDSNKPGTSRSPSLASRREMMRAGGSDTGWAELQWAAYRCCPHAGSTTWAQSVVLMRGRATRHSCRMMRTSLGEGLEHNGTVSGLLFTHSCRQHHWLVGWLVGWLLVKVL